MKILVQVLRLVRENSYNDKMYYSVDNSLTEEMSTVTKAKKRLKELSTEFPECKIRVIEYRNDEPDETRTACKVIE